MSWNIFKWSYPAWAHGVMGVLFGIITVSTGVGFVWLALWLAKHMTLHQAPLLVLGLVALMGGAVLIGGFFETRKQTAEQVKAKF